MLFMGKDNEVNALHCNTLLKLGYQYDEYEYVGAQTGATIKVKEAEVDYNTRN
jgi:hypothetical protein